MIVPLNQRRTPTIDISGPVGRIGRQNPDIASALMRLQEGLGDAVARLHALETDIADAPVITVLNRTGEVIAKIGRWGQFEGAFFKNVMIGPDPGNPQIYQDSSGDVFIDGSVIVTGTLSATAFDTLRPEPVGLTVTSNSPSAGSIAWNAHTIAYAGTAYSISGSNTSSMFVWWNAGDSSLTAGSTFTPQAGRFLILTNSSGTYDTAFNKNAVSGIGRTHLNFSLLEGMAVQAPSEVSFVNLNPGTTPSETNILNVSGQSGVLLGIQVKADNSATGGVVASIRFTIDGATAQDYQLYDNTLSADGKFKTSIKDLGDFPQTGDGATAGDIWTKRLGIPFTTSCNVKVRVTAANGSSKTVTARAEYALKV